MLLLFAVLELASLSSGRVTMAVSTSVFFLAYGLGLVVCAGGLYRLHSWGRSPVILAQLIQLGLAWSFKGGETTWVAIGLAVSALVVIAGLLHPTSVLALADDPPLDARPPTGPRLSGWSRPGRPAATPGSG